MAASCAMKLSPAVAQPQLARRATSRVSAKVALPLRSAVRANVVTRAQQTDSALQTVGLKVEQAIAVSTAVSTFLVAGNAQAAQEIAAIAADNRLGTISLLFLPVIGWVGFNILGPALRQLDSMSGDAPAPKKGTSRVTKKKGLAAAVGLTAASMFAVAESANAATEFAQLADSDGRLGAILTLFLPALGWVAFNIAGPALRQLSSMSSDAPTPKKGTSRVTKKRGLAAAAGLTAAASLFAVESANAATEFAQVADSDARLGAILTLFLPALGWVAFNIAGPALRQLDSMSGDSPAPKKAGTSRVTKKRGLAAAAGLTAAASMFAVESANAATEFAQVADSDGRLGAILTLFVPAIGWVAFNIAGPALRQLSSMSGDAPAPKKGTSRVTKKRGLAAAAGLTAAASMLAVESANAATEFAQVADSDGRLGAILTLFVPAIGWVAFNIAGPALRQLSSMSGDSPAPKKAGTKTKRK